MLFLVNTYYLIINENFTKMEKRNIRGNTSAAVPETASEDTGRRRLRCLRRIDRAYDACDFSDADLTAPTIYGEPLSVTLSRQQVSGTSDSDMLASAPDTSFDTDGTSVFDFTANYGFDSFDRVQAAIDNGVSAAMAKASVAQAGTPIVNPSADPEDGKADTDNIVKPN